MFTPSDGKVHNHQQQGDIQLVRPVTGLLEASRSRNIEHHRKIGKNSCCLPGLSPLPFFEVCQFGLGLVRALVAI